MQLIHANKLGFAIGATGAIFYIGCNAVMFVVGKNATFERVQHESQILSLGEFYFFCKTFNVYNETFNKAVLNFPYNKAVNIILLKESSRVI